jgi:hypothetical protein
LFFEVITFADLFIRAFHLFLNVVDKTKEFSGFEMHKWVLKKKN